MNEEDARRTLLEILQQWLEEHRRDEERDPAEGETLVLSQDHFEQFGMALGWSARETSALYKRLVLEDYIRQFRDERTFLESRGVVQMAWVEDLTDKGMKVIGLLRDPTEALIQALTAAKQDVVEAEDMPEDNKRALIEWLDRGVTIVRTIEGAAQIYSQHFGHGG
jgi:hypothetical protein